VLSLPLWRKTDPCKVRKGIVMDNNQRILECIVKCIKDTGNDPRTQIKGYVVSGNECYITRCGDARGMIKSVEVSCLERYVEDLSA